MVAVEVETLQKEFPVSGGVEVAVDGIDVSIDDGEFLTLLGPSGCGKTTTLRCIAGLEEPTSGEVYFDGERVTHVPANERNLAMMFQNIALYPHMTIQENIAYPLKVRHVDEETRLERAREVAESMQIEDLLNKYPGDVSGGQRQRAALARTIVQDPIAFLMDEPLSDLDAKLKTEIQEEIQKVHKQLDKPTIYVTHDQQEALRMSDRIAVLDDGKIVQIGDPREVYDVPVNQFVAKFIGNPSMNFFEGSVESDGTTTTFTNRQANLSVEFEPAKQLGELTGSAAVLGIRPQKLSLTGSKETAALTGDIVLVEDMDDRKLVTVDVAGQEIKVIVPGESSLTESETTGITTPSSGLYLFDGETEELVLKGEQ
jgi:multiple sugar transport system ATP-binding protein